MNPRVKTALKNHLLLWLVFFFNVCSAQTLKEKLQGNWICEKITDASGNETKGEFTESRKYLRYSFSHNHVSIAQAPYDVGWVMPVTFGSNTIDPELEINWYLPNLIYSVVSIDSANLILGATNALGMPIYYNFYNLDKLERAIKYPDVLDVGSLLITSTLSESSKIRSGTSDGIPMLVDYKITSERSFASRCPTFKDDRFSSFGSYVRRYFVFPKQFHSPKSEEENDVIVDFDVSKNGIKNIKIIKGLGYEMNAALFLFLEEASKKWRPVTINSKAITTRLRFHFILFKE